jgi:mono/diheme cytochrome c family protein
MARTFDKLVAALALVLTAVPGTRAAPENPTAPADAAFFEQEVLPLLKARCFKCHGDGKVRGNLRLTSREGILKGGDLGPAVILARPEDSNLLRAINRKDGLEMPPSGKLPPKEIETLTRWVKAGLPWPQAPGAQPGGLEAAGGRPTYWAYQPVRRPAVPRVKNPAWVQTPLDAFVLAQLETHGLAPAPPADRVALIRRATYDLIGLPPTPEQVDAFVRDRAPDAYGSLLDRLLASPQYGEKWGRHWLDLVRFAETNGYERDGPKPFAWRYRDYVIRSFNADKPYDRFLKEQLAGDELPDGGAEAVIATGYYRLGLWDDEPADPMQARYDELDDYVATTAQVFLAMTMNCARCHDHKIDPIPQKDYYQLLAFFQDVPHFSDTREVRSRFNLTDVTPPEIRVTYEPELRRREARKAELIAEMTRIEDDAIRKMPAEDQRAAEGVDRPQVIERQLKKFLTPEQDAAYTRLQKELKALRKRREPARQELALSVNHCTVNPVPTQVLMRGNPHAPGARVEPAFPAVFCRPAPTMPPPGPGARSSGRRTVLAEWIASPDNPLTARVLVNRLWQHHFGRGIVPTPNDFGRFGEPPTHPELLDWLASEFLAGGWRMKRLHKLLMLSNAYQMSSRASADGLRQDPANRLFWRFNMRRLSAEEVRDSMLAVSGRLNLRAGGPSVYPPIPKEVLAGQSRPGEGWEKSSPEEAARRSVYAYVKRSLLVPILSQHDQADTDSSCPVRYTTTVPTQALGMLNGEFTQEEAAALAERLRGEAPGNLEAQVRQAARLTTGHEPTPSDLRKDMTFIGEAQARDNLSEWEALRRYCLLALNTNEFLYLD